MSPGVPFGDMRIGVVRLKPDSVLLGALMSTGFQDVGSSGVVV